VEGFLELGEQEGLARTSATLSQTLRANARDPLLRELYAAQAEFREASQARSVAMDPSRLPDDPVAALRVADAATLQRRAAGYRVERATTQVASAVGLQRMDLARRHEFTAQCKCTLERKSGWAADSLKQGVMVWAAELLIALGRPDEAVEVAGRRGISGRVAALLRAGRPLEILNLPDEEWPTMCLSPEHLAEAHLLMGNPKDALEYLQRMGDKAPRHLVAIAQYMQGDRAASKLTLGGMVHEYGRTTFGWEELVANIALVYANQGNVIEAVRWLRPDRYTRTLDAHLVVQSPFVPKEVREHPEWRRQLREMFAAPDQLAQIEFEVPLPPPPPASV
jgi:hypothetical protein